MADFIEFGFADGTAVAIQVFPAATPPTDTVPGFGDALPVARGHVGTAANTALRTVLTPLVPVLESVHATVCAMSDPPDRLEVSLGVRIGQDLRLAIVGASGEASLTVTASWDRLATPEAG